MIPRAHDCITLFLGSKERYREYFQANPGSYFKTTGWIERNERGDLQQLSVQHATGMDMTYEQLVEKYGEDNAKYIYEQIGDRKKNYRQITFIEMGVEPDDSFEQHSREEAEQRGWKYEKIPGNLSLLQRLVDGPWDESEFLVVPPGGRIEPSYDDQIVTLEIPPP